MTAKPKAPGVTPSQTIGPFFHEALAWACTPAASDGDDVRVEGVVVDGHRQRAREDLGSFELKCVDQPQRAFAPKP